MQGKVSQFIGRFGLRRAVLAYLFDSIPCFAIDEIAECKWRGLVLRSSPLAAGTFFRGHGTTFTGNNMWMEDKDSRGREGRRLSSCVTIRVDNKEVLERRDDVYSLTKVVEYQSSVVRTNCYK